MVGGGEDRLWGRRRRRLAIRGVITADGQASPEPKKNAGVDGREAGEGTTTLSPLADDAASNGDGSVRPSTLLLAVRLQSALALGRGPSVASALTTMVTASAGGGWKLVRPLPVMVREGRWKMEGYYRGATKNMVVLFCLIFVGYQDFLRTKR